MAGVSIRSKILGPGKVNISIHLKVIPITILEHNHAQTVKDLSRVRMRTRHDGTLAADLPSNLPRLEYEGLSNAFTPASGQRAQGKHGVDLLVLWISIEDVLSVEIERVRKADQGVFPRKLLAKLLQALVHRCQGRLPVEGIHKYLGTAVYSSEWGEHVTVRERSQSECPRSHRSCLRWPGD